VDETVLEETVPTMDKRIWAWIRQKVDFVFLYDRVGDDRVLVVRGKDRITASVGPQNCFLDHNGEEVYRILMPNDPTKGYETILAGFNNELPDYDREKERVAALKKQEVAKKLQQKIKS
tara:strand:- start:802 stop:1158 length:357 start_codon:yes stop_codon:yes gene_type:complete